MTALITNNDEGGLISRRSIFIGAAAALICAPVIVRITNLMPVRRILKSDVNYMDGSTDCGPLDTFRRL